METFYSLTRTEFYEYDGESEIDKMNLIITQKERKQKEGTQFTKHKQTHFKGKKNENETAFLEGF